MEIFYCGKCGHVGSHFDTYSRIHHCESCGQNYTSRNFPVLCRNCGMLAVYKVNDGSGWCFFCQKEIFSSSGGALSDKVCI